MKGWTRPGRRSHASRGLLLLLVALAGVLSSTHQIAAQNGSDADGDGVIDSLDCHPGDARVASPHTYYFDLDGDLSGDAANPATLCSATPFPGTSLWHGDPDDHDPARRTPVVPRGARRLALDFSDTAADGAWRPDLARELGADGTTLHVIWSQIETAPGRFDGPQVALLDTIVAAYARDGFALHLTVSPITQLYLTVPNDLAASLQAGDLTFESPAFVARFRAFLDFVRGRLSSVRVDGLQIGHEVDRYLEVRSDGDFWGPFVNFFAAARSHAQLLWGSDLSVGITATSRGLLTGPASSLMAVLNGAADHVSVTYVPRSSDFDAPAAEAVRGEVQGLIALSYPKPLMFASVAAPSAVSARSSTAEQAQFLEAFFAVWDEYAAHVPLVSFARLYDWPVSRAAAEAASAHVNAGPALTAATAFLETLGLRDYETGTPKPAYDALRMLALERGWWRERPSSSRTSLVGFTPALYDRVGTDIEDAVVTNVMGRIEAAADMALLQFDSGVPWAEALADGGTGPLPYSANVRATWETYRAARPPGTRLAVAINPIGIPRWQLAPYWGVGEDYVLNDQYEPVGTGNIRDFESRLLPAEWRNRQLDDPAVKAAFTSYARRALQFFSPDYLIIGIEANLALDRGQETYDRFLSLQRHVYEALKADPATAHVPILVSFVAEHLLVDRLGTHYLVEGAANAQGLRQQHLDALAASAPFLDMLGFSTYPLKTLFGTARPPAAMFDHLMESVRTVTPKPVAITETGFPAAAFTVRNQTFQGSPDKQAQFYRLLFAEAEKHGFEFVTSYTPFDMTPFMDRLRAGAQRDPPEVSPDLVEFFKYFEFMGLFDLDGAARPAGQWLLDHVARPVARAESWVTPVSLSSPSGTITASVGVSPEGELFYTVDRGGQRVLDASALGQIVDGVNLGRFVTNVELSPPVEVDETYRTRGVHTTGRNHHMGATVTVRRSPLDDRTARIEFRVFDDGVAYRYEVPGDGLRAVGGEVSAWTLPEGSRVWHQVNTENYEANYRGTIIGFFDDDIGGPVTAELPGGGYVLLTEAALKGYSGMTYDADLASTALRGEFLDSASWTVPGGTTSPWRVVLTTATLDALVNSDIVTSLNPAPDAALFPEGAETRWIKPGRAVWSWWSNTSSGFSYDVQRRYVDLAHQLRAEHQIIDAGWEQGFPAGGHDAFQRLAALSAYSRVQWRDVGLWVWKYWYELADPVARNEFLARVAEAGAVGVKVDNVYGYQSESFDNVALQEAILRDAAAHRLMINFHGVAKSTGLQRTYPNEVTREGFMGLELNGLAWDRGLFVPPEHNAAAPFVRLVAGPGDYTPVTLDPRKVGPTTFAHQLATAGIFTSPLQPWADDPEVLLQQPLAVDLLRTIPVEWEETRVLAPSEIGRLVLLARRAAGRWYLFAINGDATAARTLPAVPLDFLGAGRWSARTIADATRTSLFEERLDGLTAASTLAVPMLGGGGFVAVISPTPDRAKTIPQGFSSIPPAFTADGWQRGYSMLRDHADLVSHSLQEGVPWPEALLSSDPAAYSDHLRGYWNVIRSANAAVIPAHRRYLMLNPIEAASYERLAPYFGERDYMPLPSPWDSYDFNHPNVKQAFTNYAVAAIDYFAPTYVAIGIEANILLAKRPDRWAAYKELNEHVYRALKARYPSLVVFTTVQYEQMLGLFTESERLAQAVEGFYPGVLEREVIALLQNSDLFALSTYPYMVENNILIGPSARLDADYYDRAVSIARATGKPLAFEQSGYSSRDLRHEPHNVTLPGSEERQLAFVEHVLDAAHVSDAEFVINFVAVDYGANYGDSATMMTWAYTGLRREDGSDKPALAAWDAYRAPLSGSAAASAAPLQPSAEPAPSFESFAASLAEASGRGALAPPGGDADAPPPPELWVRWQQFASMLPVFQPPPEGDPTAPWSFPEPYGAAARAALARRDAFLPYLEPLFRDFERTGHFALRLVSNPGDAPSFMVGDWVLIAPVVQEGASSRAVALPADADGWMDWYTGERYAGGQTVVVEAPLERMPILIRVSN